MSFVSAIYLSSQEQELYAWDRYATRGSYFTVGTGGMRGQRGGRGRVDDDMAL